MTSETNCVFCGFDPRFIIEETDLSIATYSKDAIKKGHIILAVKQHVTTFSELSEPQAADLFALAARVARRAQPVIGAMKYYIVAIYDAVPHFHIHLLPRMPGDPPIGPHIMGDAGWKSEAGSHVSDSDISDFISAWKNRT